MMTLNVSWINIAILLLSILLGASAMSLFSFGKNHFLVEGKTILVTGGSDGMGRSVAKILAQKGAHVVIVSRNVEKLQSALGEIKAAASNPSQRFHYISADLSKADEAVRIVSEVTSWNNNNPPDTVWCIAGGSHPDLFLNVTPTLLRSQMDLNYWSQADMAHAILKVWLSPSSIAAATASGSQRHFIFTSTSLAFYSIAGYGPYSPAKTALRSLSDTLAQEVLLYTPKTVKIHTVFPGGIQSPGWDNEELTKPAITKILEKDDPVQQPDTVAQTAVRGLEKGQYLIVVNFLAQAMRACAWGGSRRNNWVLDTLMTWVVSIVWFFISSDLDGKVVKYGKEHGHPDGYTKV